ncbi:MAG: hypothetical protein HQ534_11315 [Armatimonadetes bacterium]|nr:hypothetical protein [Armatimonadota bacterium]
MGNTRKLYGSGVHIMAYTGIKYNFNGSSSINPLPVCEPDAVKLLEILSKGQPLIREVKPEKGKVVIEVVDKLINIDEAPEPEMPELGTNEELIEEVIEKNEELVPEPFDWKTAKWHTKKQYAIANGYDGENGYKTEALDGWFEGNL